MKAYLIAVMAFGLTGCAAPLTAFFERSTRTETVVHGPNQRHPALAPYVAGISVSSSRRMIISARRELTPGLDVPPAQNLPMTKGGPTAAIRPNSPQYYTCSEPPPDTGVSSDLRESLALSAGGSGTHVPALSASDSAALTAIVLSRRTELVELWRTTTYAICLMRMNGDSENMVQVYLNAAEKVLLHASNSKDVAKEVQDAQAAQTAQAASAKLGATTSIIAPANSVVVTVPSPPAEPADPEVPVAPNSSSNNH